MRQTYPIFVFVLPLVFYSSCKKSGFLDAKPDQSISIPTSIKDCQALLDNDIAMNGYGASGYPSLGETGSDDFYVTGAQYSRFTLTDQHAVVWAQDIYTEDEVNDWDLPYRTVLYANVVLKALDAVHPSADDQAAWNNARGSAFFFPCLCVSPVGADLCSCL